MAIPLQREPEIEYPESDGKPMAESPIHLKAMLHLIGALDDHFAGEPDVYVSGNMFIYFEKRKPPIAPDLFVVRGVPKGDRDVYLLWQEGKAPCFVLEVTSKSTREEDEISKKSRYAQLGVEEYFLFDPRSEYLHPRFQGFLLTGGAYQPLRLSPDGGLTSRTLGISFRPQGKFLRMTDVKTGRLLLTYEEWKAKAQEAEGRAEAAQERAEAESVARRAAEERAEAESVARQAAEEQAEVAKKRAAEAEARAQALAEELERLRRR
jgi:Uma2 family endonuclease